MGIHAFPPSIARGTLKVNDFRRFRLENWPFWERLTNFRTMSKTENQQDLPKKSSPEHEMGNCYNERKVFARNLCPSRLATT